MLLRSARHSVHATPRKRMKTEDEHNKETKTEILYTI